MYCTRYSEASAIRLRSRGVAQPGSASALGAEGRQFESDRPDQHNSFNQAVDATIPSGHETGLMYECRVQICDDFPTGGSLIGDEDNH